MRFRTRVREAVLVLLASALTSSAASASIRGGDLESMLAADAAARAAAVSGPAISVFPLVVSFGTVNIGDSASREVTIRNIGDADLEISGIVSSDPQLTTDAPLPLSVAPGGAVTTSARYAPTGSALAATLEFSGNATNGAFRINATGQGNSPPVLDPIGDLSAAAFIPLGFKVTATDLDEDLVSLSVEGLPAGATFNPETGDFAWMPAISDEGVHDVTFAASDGLAQDAETIRITVAVLNRPPVADPGGPYAGTTGHPVQFDGSGSSDPDGNSLAYAWSFGDATTGTGVTPTHGYEFANEYSVSLTVTDDGFGNLGHSASTTASIAGLLRCGPSAPQRVLVDGVNYDTCGPNFFRYFPDFLSSNGLEVHELPYSFFVTRELLEQYPLVIRHSIGGDMRTPEAEAEAQAYRDYVANGGRLILLVEPSFPLHLVAEAFDIEFRGRAIGQNAVVRRFTPHPITQGLTAISYILGVTTSGIFFGGGGISRMPVGATILGYLPDDVFMDLDGDLAQDPGEPLGAPVMGITSHGEGEVFFIGSAGPTFANSFSRPLWSNLIRYLVIRAMELDVDPSAINLASRARWVTAYLESPDLGAANVDLTTVRLNGLSPTEAKSALVGDHDSDGVPDLALKFSRQALDPLLAPGTNTLKITGSFLTGERFEGSDEVKVIDPSHGPPLTASVAPNPLNPAGVLTISTSMPGKARVRLFDIRGRLVRRLLEARLLPAGVHEVRIDGRGEGARPLATGVYFYRVDAAGAVATGRIAILE